MSHIFLCMLSLLFIVSCSSQPAVEENTATACEMGDCTKTFDKLAGPLTEQPAAKPAKKKKRKH